MYLIKNTSNDPYFNMAAEEYFLDHFKENLICLWRNDNTVVIGRNQNAMEEIDSNYVKEHNVSVVRRLSGGGAVFHDLGNVNYTVIEDYCDNLFSNYSHFTKPVCDYLQTLGVNAVLSGRNDLLIDGMKFCGNAQAKRGNRLMHHGCILFAADVNSVSAALTPGKLKLESKSVKSVRSRITNVSSHLPQSMRSQEFLNGLYSYFLHSSGEIQEYQLTKEDRKAIQELADQKYQTWEWTYGQAPAFNARQIKRYEFGTVEVCFNVKEGLLTELVFYGDFFGIRPTDELADHLQNAPYTRNGLKQRLSSLSIGDYIGGMTEDQLLSLLME